MHDNTWVATSYGALDISNLASAAEAGLDCMVLPTLPSEPVGLRADAAALWRRLVAGPVPEGDLSADQLTMVREFEQFGLASTDARHPARTTSLPSPWLTSPLHELVYALIAHLARERGVRIVFIKGPALHRQGLRDREDSGDVDAWVDPAGVGALRDALIEWGWTVIPTMWGPHPPSHSVALRPDSWGCEIDLHHDFPGVGVPGRQAFAVLSADAERVSYAGVAASVPAPDAHAVIAALHTARPQPGVPAPVDAAAEHLRRAGGGARDAARRLRADAALAPALALAFPSGFAAPAYDPPPNWTWRAQPTAFRAYTTLLRGLPVRDRARLLARLLWPPSEMALAADRIKGGHARTAFGARCRRLPRIARRLLQRTP